jgi:hypothetical protein
VTRIRRKMAHVSPIYVDVIKNYRGHSFTAIRATGATALAL